MYQLHWLVKRNMKLFFKDPKKIIMTFFSPIITIVIFILFGRYLFASQLGKAPIPDLVKSQFADGSLLVGLLGLTSLTNAISLSVFMVQDAEKKIFNDLAITPIKPSIIRFSYLLVNILLNIIISVVMYLIVIIYMAANGTLGVMSVATGFIILGIILLGCVFNSALFSFIFSFLKSISAFSALSGALSSVSGFLIGAFIPLTILPAWLSAFSTVLPSTEVVSLLRYYIFSQNEVFASFPQSYDITLANYSVQPWVGFVYVGGFTILSLILAYVFTYNAKRQRN
ncbi:ABC transporter permease [Mycoplasma seminis]|uniref:Transport permease protein n=1 Tax=Mycoplasma seminis TaxID=512749 RepID=A0ABY9HA00_9MOLU|nr:ABC transporter permease [Mycoplasma seminis]WLP85417.1 ABC transporter permease [Mycoplasma seminis]